MIAACSTPQGLHKTGSNSGKNQTLLKLQHTCSCEIDQVYTPLTATHSMISVYFGCMTIVLKFPLTRAASTKGLHRYSGLGVEGDVPVGEGSDSVELEGNVAEVGVVDLRGGRGARAIDRLEFCSALFQLYEGIIHVTHPMELKNDMVSERAVTWQTS